MSRDGSGNYTLPLPDVITGTTIESSWANTTLSDIETEMTDSLSRSGVGGMLAVLKLIDGAEATPALTWNSDADCGLYRAAADDVRMSVGGTGQMRWTATGVQVWEDATWKSLITYPSSASDNDTLRYDDATSTWVANSNVTTTATGDLAATGSVTADSLASNYISAEYEDFANDGGLTLDGATVRGKGAGLWLGGDNSDGGATLVGGGNPTINWASNYLGVAPATGTTVFAAGHITNGVRFAVGTDEDTPGTNVSKIYYEDKLRAALSCGTGQTIFDGPVKTQEWFTIFGSQASDPTVESQADGYIYMKSTGEGTHRCLYWKNNANAYNVSPITGTFTPTICDSSLSDAEGQTYTANSGYFSKTGNLVWFNLVINVSSIGTLTTSQGVRINNLPYASSLTSIAGQGTFPVYATGLSTTAGQAIQANLIAAGDQHLELVWWDATNGCTPTLFTDLGTGSLPWYFMITGTYRTDAID